MFTNDVLQILFWLLKREKITTKDKLGYTSTPLHLN